MTAIVLELDAVVEVGRSRAFLPAATRELVFDAKATAGLHPAVPAIAVGIYAAMVAAFWVGFVGTVGVALPMAIVTLVLVAFFGGVGMMAAIRRRFLDRNGIVEAAPGSFRRFLAGHFGTGSGAVSGLEALVLVVTVPVCLLLAAVAFAIIYNLT
jgi:hypothetical protein